MYKHVCKIVLHYLYDYVFSHNTETNKRRGKIKDTISLLTLRLNLILYFLQKLKVWDPELTVHCDVLVLSVLIQRVLGGVRAKQNQGKFILGLRKYLRGVIIGPTVKTNLGGSCNSENSEESLPGAARTSG